MQRRNERCRRPAEELPRIILTADAGVVPYRNDPFTDGLLLTRLMGLCCFGSASYRRWYHSHC